MLVISTSAVLAPPFFDFAMSFLEDAKNPGDLALRDAVILRYFDARLKPDLQLTVRRFDVSVHAIFFT